MTCDRCANFQLTTIIHLRYDVTVININFVTPQDYHGIGNIAPVKDESQDYTLVGGKESNGKTVLKFKRKILACDSQDRDIPVGFNALFANTD